MTNAIIKMKIFFSPLAPWSAVILACVLPFLRMGAEFEPRDFLWAEDGNVFLKSALTEGVNSIFSPYAGYLHVYQRLIALIAAQADLFWTPTLFLLGWSAAAMVLFMSAWAYLRRMDIKPAIALATCSIIYLQPHSGEVFFNLTNVQWLTGPSLALLALSNFAGPIRLLSIVYISAAALTGPFAIILTPILAWRAWIFKRIRTEDCLVAVGASVQFIIYLHSERGKGELADPQLIHWLSALWTFLTFGSQYFIIQLCSLAFWATIAFRFVSDYRVTRLQTANQYSHRFLLMFGVCIFIASLYAVKGIPNVISPRGDGARYFFVPYTTAIIYFTVSQDKLERLGFVKLAMLLAVFLVHFEKVNHENRQFRAFQAAAAVEAGVKIPLNPKGWSFSVQKHPTPENYLIKFSLIFSANDNVHHKPNAPLVLTATRKCNPGDFVVIALTGPGFNVGNYDVFSAEVERSPSQMVRIELFKTEERIWLAYIQPLNAPAVAIKADSQNDWKNPKVSLRCINRQT